MNGNIAILSKRGDWIRTFNQKPISRWIVNKTIGAFEDIIAVKSQTTSERPKSAKIEEECFGICWESTVINNLNV